MDVMTTAPKATVIISIYRDIEALDVILYALEQQSVEDFSVIISEDGDAPEVAEYLSDRKTTLSLHHLTQPDLGFRKNRALNRAILAAPAETLIFIDGDCIPHPGFVEAHLRYAASGHVGCGRRIELGPQISAELRREPSCLELLTRPLSYLRLARSLHRDGIKNYELGFTLPWLQPLLKNRSIAIVGCNFSARRSDLIAINGFNEEYEAPGIGEDSDIEWRLRQEGMRLHDIRFTAVQYHLHHPRGYQVSERNRSLLKQTRGAASPFCKAGLDAHLGEIRND
jgi:GT2 family glycosyltransferase